MIDILQCPVCGRANEGNELIPFKLIEYLQCSSCELYYQHKYMSPDELKLFYIEDYAYNIGKGRNALHRANQTKKLNELRYNTKLSRNQRKGMDDIIAKMPVPSRVLEIGADAGGCSINLKSKGHSVEAVELHDLHADRMEEQGIKVYRDLFEDVDFGTNKYDYIIALEVLEHIVNPTHFIKKVYELLEPNGFFILETPIVNAGLNNNTSKFGFQFAHPCIFTTHTLPILLKDFRTIPEFETGNTICYMIGK